MGVVDRACVNHGRLVVRPTQTFWRATLVTGLGVRPNRVNIDVTDDHVCLVLKERFVFL